MIIAKFEKIVIWTLLVIFLLVPTFFVPAKTFAQTQSDSTMNLTFGAQGAKSINLSWSMQPPDSKIVKYQISRDGDVVTTTTATSYADTNVTDESIYHYQIDGLNAAGESIVKRSLDIKKTGAVATTTVPAPPAPPADGESCTKHCPGGTWWWKVDDNIQNAICNMQCTIIDWESSMIGWVVAKVLYPALGLCIENDASNPCPEPPNVTETK